MKISRTKQPNHTVVFLCPACRGFFWSGLTRVLEQHLDEIHPTSVYIYDPQKDHFIISGGEFYELEQQEAAQ